MITVASLVAGALTVSLLGPRLLAGLGRPGRDPVLALWAWLLTSFGVVASSAAALVLVLVPGHGLGTPGLESLLACWAAIRGSTAPAVDLVIGSIGTLLVTAAALRAGVVTTRAAARRARLRRDHLAILSMAANDDGTTLWVPHPRPAAFSVAGPRRVIVATTGLARLPDPLAGAVLAHETAHLRGRHHLLISTADALAALGRPLPLFSRAPVAVRELVERVADRAASRVYGPVVVARALQAVAGHAAPPGALSAAVGPLAARLEALAVAERRVARCRSGWHILSRAGAATASACSPLLAAALALGGLALISCS